MIVLANIYQVYFTLLVNMKSRWTCGHFYPYPCLKRQTFFAEQFHQIDKLNHQERTEHVGIKKPSRTQCGPVEYSSHWVREVWVRVGHVDSMLFVLFLFALGTQRECGFWWNTGLL